MWRDVKHPKTGRLLFRYDPERAIIQIQQRGEKVTVDLEELRDADKESNQTTGQGDHAGYEACVSLVRNA